SSPIFIHSFHFHSQLIHSLHLYLSIHSIHSIFNLNCFIHSFSSPYIYPFIPFSFSNDPFTPSIFIQSFH
ncbi:hypothetical protein PENTCL1PPCAC_27672, partial [Pristionchus entomophagus]